MPPSVLIVDDHATFREQARLLLESEGFTVVGEADQGEAVLAAVTRLRPEVVLLDVGLPGLDGFAVAEQLAGRPDPPAVVLISNRSAASYRRRLEQSPARGFIAKNDLSGACLHALLA